MGELISQGGVSLRVRGVKVPRGILFFFFPYFSRDGVAFIPSFVLGGRKELSRGYLGVCWSVLDSCGLGVSTSLRIAWN